MAEVRFQYVDDRDNVYTVRYGGSTPGNCKMVEFSAPSFSVAENVSPPANIRCDGWRPDRRRHGQLHDEQRDRPAETRTTRTPARS